MALLSDIDWMILLAAGGLLLFGRESPDLLRTLGRWYGRALRLKQELLSEVTRAADLPTPSADRPLSIRSAFLGLERTEAARSRVPLAVMTVTAAATPSPPSMTWANSLGAQQWSVATTRFPEFEGGRR
jgi:Sec-independent protein translocase protein TatA